MSSWVLTEYANVCHLPFIKSVGSKQPDINIITAHVHVVKMVISKTSLR